MFGFSLFRLTDHILSALRPMSRAKFIFYSFSQLTFLALPFPLPTSHAVSQRSAGTCPELCRSLFCIRRYVCRSSRRASSLKPSPSFLRESASRSTLPHGFSVSLSRYVLPHVFVPFVFRVLNLLIDPVMIIGVYGYCQIPAKFLDAMT